MIMIFALLNLLTQNTFAATNPALPRLSVLRFQDEASQVYEDCDRWPTYYVQSQLHTQLETALAHAGFAVQERRQVNELYDHEFELINSDQKSKPKRGGFKAAQYSLAGALTEMGLCAEHSANHVAVGGLLSLVGVPGGPELALAKSGKTARLKMVLQLINVETAETEETFEAKAEAKESSGGISASLYGIGGSHESSQHDVLGAASAEAVQKLVADVKSYFTARSHGH